MALRGSSGVPQCNRETRIPLATKALLCKQSIGNFRSRPAPWRHLSSNRVLFVPHFVLWLTINKEIVNQIVEKVGNDSKSIFILIATF